MYYYTSFNNLSSQALTASFTNSSLVLLTINPNNHEFSIMFFYKLINNNFTFQHL